MRARALALFAIFSLPVLGVACAEAGVEGLDDDDVLPAPDPGDASVPVRPDSGPASPPRGSSSSSGGSSDGGSSGRSSDGGSSDGGSSSGGSSSGSNSGQPDVCSGATCAGATDLGTMSGDDGAPARSTSGNQSKWVTVSVKDTAFGGLDISWTLHFVPAAGVDYEVRVADASGASCSTTTVVVPPAQYDTYENHWTDDQVGVDDGHDVYVQVKQIGGSCPSATQWTLRIEGNTY